ncbi:GNAT family N-acetyltransferase [Corynebacterium kroppenstedtii]|uniref:GNAT family N-acetyltransferase n=1 Tax=Corynebacterium sp. PCR 32 TaxID=3351342 RepID=UPI0030952927
MALVQLDVSAAAACAELEARLFPEDSPWPYEGFVAELNDPRSVYVGLVVSGGVHEARCMAVGSVDSPDEAIRDTHILVGYAGLGVLGPAEDPEFEVRTIGLDATWRGHGLGRVLLETILYAADREHGPVFLEVRTDNAPAIGLYESTGFTVLGTRTNYYQPSGADAYVMKRDAQAR